MRYERYAIYWSPPRGSALADFGQTWLGVDPEAGAYVEREHFGLDQALSASAVASPRRYCLHATMKAPFRLAPEASEAELRASMAAFCARRRRFEVGPLRLHAFGDYLTLMPEPPLADLDWLAAECVTHFDPFRASLDETDRARRPPNLPEAQAALMDQFGYPYVLGQFIFHVTLAGPLAVDERAKVRNALAPAVAPFSAAPLAIEDLCLFGDPGGKEPFHLVERFPLMR